MFYKLTNTNMNTKKLAYAHRKKLLGATSLIAVVTAIALVQTFVTPQDPVTKQISELRQEQVGYSIIEKDAKEEWALAMERVKSAEQKAQDARNELTQLENRIQSLVRGEKDLVVEAVEETEGKE